MVKIGIIGAGGWGTALAVILSEHYEICMWEKFPDYAGILNKKRENIYFLPGFKIPEKIEITSNLSEVLSFASYIIIAVPSQYFKNILEDIKKDYKNQPILIATKGMEETGLRMSDVLEEIIPGTHPSILSGPTIGREVAEKKPTAAVVASMDMDIAQKFQKILSSESFRIYTSSDVIGVELAGSSKNVIAIGAGIIDGLGLGINTKSAYLARGIEELKNLGVASGGKEKTFWGLAGLGDLITTSFSPSSRNRSYGEALAKGKQGEFLKGTKMVIEGIRTTKILKGLGEKKGIELPIIFSIYRIIYKKSNPWKEIKKLMTRKLKNE
ncbi:MAG: NAD(P)-dependent glycerol-3-phosphate dehydrogenase [Candidatus Omnitrophica bacterium]|nr:NAD(P)-dependent glycerol-3-phosphate dehydrogenase [Candidatus Omnitrophota bacterium]